MNPSVSPDQKRQQLGAVMQKGFAAQQAAKLADRRYEGQLSSARKVSRICPGAHLNQRPEAFQLFESFGKWGGICKSLAPDITPKKLTRLLEPIHPLRQWPCHLTSKVSVHSMCLSHNTGWDCQVIETLDRRKGFEQSFLWPPVEPVEGGEEAADGEKPPEEEQQPAELSWEDQPVRDKLVTALTYLRNHHSYCLHCGCQVKTVSLLPLCLTVTYRTAVGAHMTIAID